MYKFFASLLVVLAALTLRAQSPQQTLATQFVSVPKGTIIHAVGASNQGGFGSGIPWSQLMVETNPYFAGRVVYHQWTALGASPADETTQYTQHVQADCQAFKAGTGPMAWVLIETNVNGFASAQAQFTATAAVWAQAKADGCKVAAQTATDYYTFPQAVFDLNALVRSAATTSTGAVQPSNAYDVLLDLYNALPFDGCTNQTDGSCPVVADGSYADGGHVNTRGAKILADYAGCVLVTRGTCAGMRGQGVNFRTASLYNSMAPTNGRDGGVILTSCAPGSFDITAALTQGSGVHFTVRNTGGICQLTLNNGVVNAVFENGTSSGPTLSPAGIAGDQIDLLYDVPAGNAQGTVYVVRQSPPAPAYQPALPTIIVATTTNQQIPGYADLFDTAGYQISTDGGPNGPAINQSLKYHRVLLINSGTTATHFLCVVQCNGGAGVADLQPNKMAYGVYLNSTWLISDLP